MVKLGTAELDLTADTSDLDSSLDKTEGKFRGFATTVRGAGIEIGMFGRNVLGAVGNMAMAFIDFEDQFMGVRKTVDASEEEFALLSRGIRDMALDIPVATSELNRIMTIAGQLGIRGVEPLLKFTRVVADMTATTDLSAEEAAFAFARITKVTGEPIENVDRLGSTIVDLGNKFAATEPMITAGARGMAGLSNLAGLTTQNILGLSAGMAAVGVSSNLMASTTIRVFQEMRESVSDGGDQLDAFADMMGVSTDEVGRMLETDPTGAFLALAEGISQANEQGKDTNQIYKDLELNNIRVIKTLGLVGGGVDTVREAVEVSNTAWDENTALTTEADKRYSTLKSGLQMLDNILHEISIVIGESLAPAIGPVVEKLGEWAKIIGGFLEDHPTLARVFILVTAIIGSLAVAVGVAVIAFAIWAAVTGVLGVAMLVAFWWLIAIVAAIVLLVAAVVIVVEHWDEVTAAVGKFIEKIQELPVIGQIIEFVKERVISQIQSVINIFKEIISIGENVISFFQNVFRGDWEAAWEDLKEIASSILSIFLDFVNLSFIGALFALFEKIVPWDWVKEKILALKDKFMYVLHVFVDWLKSRWFKRLLGLFILINPWTWVSRAIWEFRDEVLRVLVWVKDRAVEIFKEMKEKVEAVVTTFVNALIWAFSVAKVVILRVTTELWQGILWAWGILQVLLDPVIGALTRIFETFIDVLKDAVSWIKDVIGWIGKIPDIPGVGGFGDFLEWLGGGQHGFRSSPGGWALVGEAGPELLRVPRGSDLYSTPETIQMLGGRGAQGTTINIENLWLPDVRDADEFVRALDRQVYGELQRRGMAPTTVIP